MTNTLKIPGKIVAMTETEDSLHVATETQIYALAESSIKTPSARLVFDITDYQDKPTEEIKDKKQREWRREHLMEILADSIQHGSGDDRLVRIAAIAELNKMDEREEEE